MQRGEPVPGEPQGRAERNSWSKDDLQGETRCSESHREEQRGIVEAKTTSMDARVRTGSMRATL